MVFGVWMIECLIEDVSFYLCILAIPSFIEFFFGVCLSFLLLIFPTLINLLLFFLLLNIQWRLVCNFVLLFLFLTNYFE